MSILTDLRAALDAALAGEQMKGKAWDDFRDLLDTDTIAALIAVAEAVRYHLQDACGDCAIRFCEDDSDIGCSLDDMRTALAPLVKEADDE